MTKFVLRSLLVAGLLLGADVSASYCQQLNTGAALAAASRGNWFVRVRTDSITVAEGRVTALTGTTARIGDTEVELATINQVERRLNDSRGWQRGAIAGGVVVGSMGYLMSSFCYNECDSARIGGTLLGALLGAIVGGTIGQMLAEPRYRWESL